MLWHDTKTERARTVRLRDIKIGSSVKIKFVRDAWYSPRVHSGTSDLTGEVTEKVEDRNGNHVHVKIYGTNIEVSVFPEEVISTV